MIKSEILDTCSLCFQSSNDCQPLDGLTSNMVEIVVPVIDLSESTSCICMQCLDSLRTLFDFKSRCLENEDSLQNYTSTNGEKIDLKAVICDRNAIVKKEENLDPNEYEVCRFCLTLVFKNSEIFRCSDYADLLDESLPEMNLAFATDPILCKSCHKSAEKLCTFLRSCISPKNTRIKIETTPIKTEILPSDIKQEITQDDIVGNVTLNIQPKIEENIDTSILNGKNNHYQDNKRKSYTTDKKANKKPKITEKEILNCEKCIFTTNYLWALEAHINDTHNNESTDKNDAPKPSIRKAYTCAVCNIESERRKDIEDHLVLQHTVNKKCHICKNQKYYVRIGLHMVQEHCVSTDIYHNCSKCDYSTIYLKELLTHKRLHHYLQCPYCHFKTYTQSSIDSHIEKNHLLDGEFKCEMCGCAYETSRGVEMHKHRIHKISSPMAPYKCRLCPSEFWKKTSLTHHLSRKHTKDPASSRKDIYPKASELV